MVTIPDFKNNVIERIFVAGTLGIFFFDFSKVSSVGSRITQMCWPHWQSCRSLPFPEPFPNSYAYNTLFLFVFSVIVGCLAGVIKNKEKIYLPTLWALVGFKVFYNFFWHFSGLHNFEYFHLLPTIAFLLNKKDRLFGAQVMWALCCFLAAFVKIHESWIVGSYFSSLALGLPFFPDSVIPLVTQGVIIFEIFLSWGLLTQRWRMLSVAGWLTFHIYSVILVGFYYPVRCVTMLLILFIATKPNSTGIRQLNGLSIVLMAFMIVLQMMPLAFNEDNKRTLRWEGYGFNMFDANFQCVNRITWTKNSKVTKQTREHFYSRMRCGPNTFLERIKILCETKKPDNVTWTLRQSLNGGPFKEIIKSNDACNLQFSLFGKNEWILSETEAKSVGYPAPNTISGNAKRTVKGKSKIIFKTPHIKTSSLQDWIKENYTFFFFFYLSLWISVLITVIVKSVKVKNS